MKGITKDGKVVKIPYEFKEEKDYMSITIRKDFDFSDIDFVECDYFGEVATNRDEGYFVLPRSAYNPEYSVFYYNRHQEDFSKDMDRSNIPVFGMVHKDKSFLSVISGMSHDYALHLELKDGKYRIYPIFWIFGEQPPEDLKIEYFMISSEDADYSAVARRYRKYLLDKGEITPIKIREKTSKTLSYAKESVNIRVRLGWKPAPAEIKHQTLENEPPMYVACTFQRVGDILDELKRQGVEKAEICLVGWNVKGHDGRWPEAFPVEPELGGEAELLKLIKKAQDMDYRITCHTNSCDQYEIANNYDSENTRCDRNGNPVADPKVWSGGEMFQMCPKVAWEQAQEFIPKVAELGFFGTHYYDVLGIVNPRRCWHEKHYVTSKDAVMYAKKLCDLAKEHFGGVSSEGAHSFIAPHLDYALYVGHYDCFAKREEIFDESIPFWQIVYHGTVLSNPFGPTMNPTFKDPEVMLKVVEFGGRPSYYFYSKFMNNKDNWMGEIDCRCRDDEELKESVSKIKKGYDIYSELNFLQTEFMDKHEKIEEGVYRTTYSDGSTVTVNYNENTYKLERVK